LSDPPSYSISFQQGDAVPGIGAVSAMRLPFECTNDGTVFITMLQPLVGAPPQTPAQISSSLLLISVPRAREAHSFPLNKVPDLYDISEIGHYVYESKVVFLLRAATSLSEPPEKAEHYVYIAIFDRDGNYQKKIEVEDNFQIYKIGLFPSGNYLAYGFDKQDHSPKLAMLEDDGTLLHPPYSHPALTSFAWCHLNPATINNEDPICFSENCVEAKTCTQRKCF
jgi:hypothetical protein